jgi:N-acetylglucosaminyldiphosphoundecaprenol N-acetyl-beta-D-mannosaminyltransferase
MHEAIAWLTAHSTKVEIGFFVNVNSINIGVKNRCFVDTVNRANRVFADGSGVRLGAKYHHIQVRDNINGTDLLPRLCIEASRLKLSLYLLGAAPGIAKLATEKLTAQYPQLNIVGSHHGYFNKGVEESAAVIAAINQSKADIVLIGLGSPLQERWLYRHQHHITASRALAVGGLFDFYSGRLSRAPRWIRALGMEWVWRLWQEPCAKWRRYVIGNPAYLFRLWFGSH